MNTLKELRLGKNMTQCELAAITGLTHMSISRYESGKRSISVETAKNWQKLWILLFLKERMMSDGIDSFRKKNT